MDPTPPPVSQPPVSPYPRPNLEGSGPACPKCSGTNTKEIKYTWWGGILAPKMMNLQKCEACGYLFNRATRQSVKNAIIAYNLVVLGITFVIVFVLVFAKGLF